MVIQKKLRNYWRYKHGKKRTWYVDDILDKELHRIKTEHNFRSMNEVFRYLVFEKEWK